MLTDLLQRLNPTWAHRIQAWLGIEAGLHTWLHDLCPCGIDTGDEDYFEQLYEAA
jgi:hypothetical protein